MTNIVEQTSETKKSVSNLIKGIIIAFFITTILIFILSAILTYTNISETFIPIGTVIVSSISILVGAFLSTHHIKKNGIMNGGIIGAIYIITLYILSSIISGNFSINTQAIIMIIICILTGAIGGVLGVNTKK